MPSRAILSGLVVFAMLALSMSTLVPAARAQEKYPSRPSTSSCRGGRAAGRTRWPDSSRR